LTINAAAQHCATRRGHLMIIHEQAREVSTASDDRSAVLAPVETLATANLANCPRDNRVMAVIVTHRCARHQRAKVPTAGPSQARVPAMAHCHQSIGRGEK